MKYTCVSFARLISGFCLEVGIVDHVQDQPTSVLTLGQVLSHPCVLCYHVRWNIAAVGGVDDLKPFPVMVVEC